MEKPNQNINLIVSEHFSSIKMSIHDSKYVKNTFYVKNPSVPYLVTQAVPHPEHDAIFR